MNKLDSKHQSLALSPVSQSNPSTGPEQRLEPAHRLIVLVPCPVTDPAAVTRRVWELANATGAHVQFLGLYNDSTRESSLRRELVTLSAMVNDDMVSAKAEVIFGKDWVDVVKMRSQPGDMVVCFAEQRVGLSHKLLSEILQTGLGVPLYILSGLYPWSNSRSNRLTQIAGWTGFIVIILGFFMFQSRVEHLAKDWTIALQLLSIPIEVWLIWLWNSLFFEQAGK